MDPRTILTRGVTTGLRLGRGTADRLVGVAGPVLRPALGRLTDRVVPRPREQDRPTPATFTPSKRKTDGPTPATVARNIAPPRPTAAPAPATKPRSAPGAKLPPRRPSTS